MNTNRREFIKKTGIGILASAVPASLLQGAETFAQQKPKIATPYNWKPDAINLPEGTARGIYPGRVAWSHAPGTAHWGGDWKSMTNPWWLDENTDQKRVTEMVGDIILQVTGKKNYTQAWKAIFEYHNSQLGKGKKGYRKGEIVAVKINMNSTNRPERIIIPMLPRRPYMP